MIMSSSRVTGDKKTSGLIRKYGLNMSRQAFREKAEDIGFKKVCESSITSPGLWIARRSVGTDSMDFSDEVVR